MLWESNRNGQRWKQIVPENTRSTGISLSKVHRTDRYGMPDDELIHIMVIHHRRQEPKGWSINRQKLKELEHYGVPGMHWGEITKEYVPKGYYKQRTMTAAQYKKRQQQKNTVSPQYEAARNAGRRVGDTFFLDARQKQKRRQQEAYERAHPKEKGPDLVDKATQKAFDHFSLGAYSQLASNFIKETAQNKALDYLKSKAGQTIKIGGKYAGNIGKIIAKPISLAGQEAIKGTEALGRLAKKGIKKVPKGLVQVGKFVGKAGKATVSGLAKASKWYRGHRADVRNSINAGRSFLKRFAQTGVTKISKFTGSTVQSGARLVQSGAKSLVNILKKIKR